MSKYVSILFAMLPGIYLSCIVRARRHPASSPACPSAAPALPAPPPATPTPPLTPAPRSLPALSLQLMWLNTPTGLPAAILKAYAANTPGADPNDASQIQAVVRFVLPRPSPPAPPRAHPARALPPFPFGRPCPWPRA